MPEAALQEDMPRSAAGRHSPWLVAGVVSIATFMEVLDSTIANVSLRHIAGGLGAGLDESTWILTSYLIANAIVLPMSGWLATLIGRKRFYMICVAGFSLASLCCALSTSLSVMIFFRVLQGLSGGGLAPVEQSLLADTFPPAKRSQAFALYGITVVVAPALGPLIGGWLTERYTWHWIFLINLPVGALALTLIWVFVDEPEAVQADRRRFIERFVPDWLGVLLVAGTFGALQVMLDRFQQDDGFDSLMITLLFVVMVFCAVALVWWERHHPQPVFDVHLFKVRSFSIACLLMFLLGFTLYSTTQLIPQLAQTLLGYDAFGAGKALAWGGFAAALMMPVAGLLSTRVPGKAMLLVAFLCTALSFRYAAGLNQQMSFGTLSLSRVYQTVALPFLFVPLTTAAYVGVPEDKNGEASAIVNLMRNLGGSVGVSVATTLLAWREQFHHARLGEHVGLSVPDAASAWGAQTLRAAQQLVQSQAQMMSYLDIFHLWFIVALCVAPVALLLKSPPRGAALHG